MADAAATGSGLPGTGAAAAAATKAAVLPVPVWRRGLKVAAGEDTGDRLGLDGRGRGVALLANGAQELGRQAEFGGLHVYYL
jgi:hypothetical protein